jgi:hypothetical protein
MSTTLMLAGLPLLACSVPSSTTTPPASRLAELSPHAGSEHGGVTLTERALRRLEVGTTAVTKDLVPSTVRSSGWVARKIVPYSSLIYDTRGGVWVYTSPEPRTFVRHRVTIYTISGDQAFLEEGPAVGTEVVALGAAEVYGTELALRNPNGNGRS